MENHMSLITSLITAAAEESHALPMSPYGYAAIAVAAFVALGVVVWSYRDVANRHSDKVDASHSDHHTPGH
jgi:heme/copper-type cytochrome/quinol oxidase subunit 2